ncbi:MAG: DinB family protein [Anaerolineaceae bacterium]
MDARSLLKEQITGAHRILNSALGGLPQEMVTVQPPGTANSIGATLAHVVLDEDWLISQTIGEPLLYASQGFEQKIGLAAPTGPFVTEEWARGVKLELAPFMEYAQAVFARTESAVANFSAEAMDRNVDLGTGSSITGLLTVGVIALNHVSFHAGEIAALKGTMNLKGIPF